MDVENWQEILKRLLVATNSTSETALASRLGISSQSIYNAKNKKQIPPGWVFEVAKTFGVSADWIFFGRGPMHPDDAAYPQDAHGSTAPVAPEARPLCSRCAELKAELELEKAERRGLSEENRQWAAKTEKLLRENGNLRERCAKLEARQAGCTATSAAASGCGESA